MRVGSLFSGIGGLDLGLEPAFGPPAWLCEFDPNARSVLERHFPSVPIYPDVREIDESAGPIDVLHGGYPCQPFSVAGLRGGDKDPRHLWPEFARLIRLLRPRIVVAENVSGHLALGFDRVLADLAEMGLNARWGIVRASDVGAPHRRERLFVVAADSRYWSFSERARPEGREAGEREPVGGELGFSGSAASDPCRAGTGRDGPSVPRSEEPRRGEPSDADSPEPRSPTSADPGSARRAGGGGSDEVGASGTGGDGWAGAEGSSVPAADPDDAGRGQHGGTVAAGEELGSAERGRCEVAADADGRGRGQLGVEKPGGLEGSRGNEPDGRDPDGELSDASTWGAYALAIERWERTIGRRAPRPTDDRGRLSPEFVEWMMGLPPDWTAGEKRTARLRMLGNAVVPAQAALAMRILT